MDSSTTLSTGAAQLSSEAIRLVKAALPSVLTYIAINSLGGMYVDQQADVGGSTLALTVVTLVLGYWMITSMLKDGGLSPNGLSAGFGAYFGLSLFSGLGIGLGLLLLVIPGLVLMVRWLPLYGYGLAEGVSVGDAFGRSWADTDGHFGPLALSLAIPFLLYALAFGIYVFASDDLGVVELLPSIVSNLAMTVAAVMVSAIGIAAYALLGRSNAALTDVFE